MGREGKTRQGRGSGSTPGTPSPDRPACASPRRSSTPTHLQARSSLISHSPSEGTERPQSNLIKTLTRASSPLLLPAQFSHYTNHRSISVSVPVGACQMERIPGTPPPSLPTFYLYLPPLPHNSDDQVARSPLPRYPASHCQAVPLHGVCIIFHLDSCV